MKKTKIVLIALLIVFICIVFVSCKKDQPSSDNNDETEAVEEICFEEVNGTSRLFNMSEENFFDVTDFSIDKVTEFGKFTSVVNFSYQPFELRTIDILNPYSHKNERLEGLTIDPDHVASCLTKFMYMEPIRVLKPDSDKKDAVIASFVDQYGVSYSLSFTHNAERNDESLPIDQTSYDFLISPLTKYNTYYLYDKNTLTVYEISDESLSFIEKSSESWYDHAIFMYHIACVKKIEIFLKPGINSEFTGELTFKHYFTDKNGDLLHPFDVMTSSSEAVLHANVSYNGGRYIIEDTEKYRDFYKTFLLSYLNEIDFNKTGEEPSGITPDMKMTVYIELDDERKTLEYSFFANDSVMLNGNYIGKLADGQVDTLIRAVGLPIPS